MRRHNEVVMCIKRQPHSQYYFISILLISSISLFNSPLASFTTMAIQKVAIVGVSPPSS